jgi:hypothetical protein
LKAKVFDTIDAEKDRIANSLAKGTAKLIGKGNISQLLDNDPEL